MLEFGVVNCGVILILQNEALLQNSKQTETLFSYAHFVRCKISLESVCVCSATGSKANNVLAYRSGRCRCIIGHDYSRKERDAAGISKTNQVHIKLVSHLKEHLWRLGASLFHESLLIFSSSPKALQNCSSFSPQPLTPITPPSPLSSRSHHLAATIVLIIFRLPNPPASAQRPYWVQSW